MKQLFKRMYRASLTPKKQQALAWKELKKLFVDTKWQHGVYENDRVIQTGFLIADENGEQKGEQFIYAITENSNFCCSVTILDTFPVELTTDIFVLVAHFNNLLREGKVVVDINTYHNVFFSSEKDILIPLLYPDEMMRQLQVHHQTAMDIYWAFQKLVIEEEAPAIIIADLLRKKEEVVNW